MPNYVRVWDKDTNRDFSVIESAAHLGNYERLDEPATTPNGVPLPPSAHKSPVKEKPGQKADTKKESDD